jgi:hypothetical protein
LLPCKCLGLPRAWPCSHPAEVCKRETASGRLHYMRGSEHRCSTFRLVGQHEARSTYRPTRFMLWMTRGHFQTCQF